jgi:hypothetical protein
MSLEENIQKLRDSLTVTSAQALRHETLLKDHAEWLQAHDQIMITHAAAVALHDREMAEMRERIDQIAENDAERGRALDERIDKLGVRIDQIAENDAERGRALDERIDKLVSAIGELIRVRNGKQ